MFVFANICDCALWKTVYDRSIVLCLTWLTFRQIQTCLSHLRQTNSAVQEQCCATAQWHKSARFDLSYILAFSEAIWQ